MAANTQSKTSFGNSLVDKEQNVSLSQVKELMKTVKNRLQSSVPAFMENSKQEVLFSEEIVNRSESQPEIHTEACCRSCKF